MHWRCSDLSTLLLSQVGCHRARNSPGSRGRCNYQRRDVETAECGNRSRLRAKATQVRLTTALETAWLAADSFCQGRLRALRDHRHFCAIQGAGSRASCPSGLAWLFDMAGHGLTLKLKPRRAATRLANLQVGEEKKDG